MRAVEDIKPFSVRLNSEQHADFTFTQMAGDAFFLSALPSRWLHSGYTVLSNKLGHCDDNFFWAVVVKIEYNTSIVLPVLLVIIPVGSFGWGTYSL